MRRLTARFGHFTAVTFIAAAFAVLGFAAASLAQNAGSGDAANGKRIYLADGCFACHGRAGQGGARIIHRPRSHKWRCRLNRS